MGGLYSTPEMVTRREVGTIREGVGPEKIRRRWNAPPLEKKSPKKVIEVVVGSKEGGNSSIEDYKDKKWKHKYIIYATGGLPRARNPFQIDDEDKNRWANGCSWSRGWNFNRETIKSYLQIPW